jgi:Phage integrase family
LSQLGDARGKGNRRTREARLISSGLPVIPSAVDPHTAEWACPRVTRWSARLDERPCHPGAGLLGFAWVAGGRDDPHPRSPKRPRRRRLNSTASCKQPARRAGRCRRLRRQQAKRGRASAALAWRFDPDNFSHRFSQLCHRAGLGHWHPHELRHSGASLMLVQGTPLHVVSDVLAHTSIAITKDLYGHLLDGGQRSAAEAMSAALFGAAGSHTGSHRQESGRDRAWRKAPDSAVSAGGSLSKVLRARRDSNPQPSDP